MSEKEFDSKYYDESYFVTPGGKKCTLADGTVKEWSYRNPTGEWGGALPVAKAWKQVFNPIKMLDVGCARGTFTAYCREVGIDVIGFDFSDWAISDKGRFFKCNREWVQQHDATKPWPYLDNQFDFLICLDLMEHIYEEDIDKLIDEMYRVCNGRAFLQIATSPYVDYSLKRGEEVPKNIEVMTLTGHVLVKSKEWWLKKLERNGWKHNPKLLEEFYAAMNPPIHPESAWMKNLMAVMERP